MKSIFTIASILLFGLLSAGQQVRAADQGPVSLGLSLYQQDASVLRGGLYYTLAPTLRLGLIVGHQSLLTYEGEQSNIRRRLDAGFASEIMLEAVKDISVDIHTSIGASKYSVDTNDTHRNFVENEIGFAIGAAQKILRIGVGTRINIDALGKKAEDLKGCKTHSGSRELCDIVYVYPYVGGTWSI